MPRTTKPLTNTEIKNAKPASKEFNLFDGGGLALRVKPNGTKFWVFNYIKPYIKKRTNLSFGKYPDVSLADARVRKSDAKSLLAKNIDPKDHKNQSEREAKQNLESTFGVVTVKWYELKAQRVKPESLKKIWLSFQKHVLPELKDIPVTDLKPKMALNVLEPVINAGKNETAKRLARTINEIMIVALAMGLIEANYLSDLTKLIPSPKYKSMPTIRPEELPELMKAVFTANISKPTRCLIEWQLHTMTRPTEAVTARWEEIDFENKLWVLPASKMKMNREHQIPLSSYVLKLLEVIQGFSAKREYLFPGYHSPRSHMNSSTANMALKRMGYKGKLVAHGLRALASTTLNENNFDPDVIEAALAHQDSNSIRKAYNRAIYLEQRREMMEWWSNFILEASKGSMSIA